MGIPTALCIITGIICATAIVDALIKRNKPEATVCENCRANMIP